MKINFYFLLCFLSLQTISSADFYCDPINGKKSNNGSKNSPWKSLQSVFEKEIKFNNGDVVYLLSGNHGDVIVTGENEKYINIKSIKGETPEIKSIIFGTDKLPASKWIFTNINFTQNIKLNTVFVHQNSSKIRLIENHFSSKNTNSTAIKIDGTKCSIESNIISNYKNGILLSGEKNQIRNNRIEFFNNNAIEILAGYNVLEYNLITESIALDSQINNGIYIHEKEIKGTIFRGNTIINFVKTNRKNIGLLNGIYSDKSTISESVFENNVIITNGENGIFLKGELNNLKIANNTVVNPYFGLKVDGENQVNSSLKIAVIGEKESSNLIIRNNLSNDVLYKNIKGIADHNLTIPVAVHEFDMCFKNWALFDFSLSNNSKALNKGIAEMAPNLDASLNKRTLGNFVNIGAFEYGKIDETNEVFTITSEITDRQIHSKGKGDWDGQTQIRIGGVAEKIDGAAVFPFKMPIIPGGKEIISANFKIYLSKIDNTPEGGVDLYGLSVKSNFWITEDMFYQGTFGQDLKARPIQNNFVNSDMFLGEVKMLDSGKKGLKSYLNTIIEAGSKPGDYAFLRMNPNSKDVKDYNRWNFVSANSNDTENHPKLEIIVGYPELNKGDVKSLKSIKNTVIVAPNPVNKGNVSFYFLGFLEDEELQIKLLNFSGEQVLNHTSKISDFPNKVYRTKNLKLTTGKYILETTVKEQTQKQIVFVW